MHPLAPDLTGLTDEELFTKKSDLQSKLTYAYRIGNADMVNQLNLLVQDYMIEAERRNAKMLEDAQKSGRLGKTGDDSAKDITR